MVEPSVEAAGIEPADDSPGACIEWTGYVGKKGYGQRGAGKRSRTELAHRRAWRDAHGEIPPGFQIHHRCSNRRCVNPAHLEAVSPRDHSRRHSPRPSATDFVAAAVRERGVLTMAQIQELADGAYARKTLYVAARRARSAGEIVAVSRGVYAPVLNAGHQAEASSPIKELV